MGDKSLQDGERKPGRFPGTGLGAREQITARQYSRDGLLLDGRRFGIFCVRDSANQFLDQAERRKGHENSGTGFAASRYLRASPRQKGFGDIPEESELTAAGDWFFGRRAQV